MTTADGREYLPLQPNDPHVLGGTGKPTPPGGDGLYNRGEIQDNEIYKEALLDPHQETHLTDYQYWVDGNWKVPHGSMEAVERFNTKVKEELREVIQAHQDLVLWTRSQEETEQARTELIYELGDLTWCTSALSSNGSVNIDEGLKRLLFEYLMKTRHFRGNQSIVPVWRETAANLSTKYEPITAQDLDGLIAAGFEPQPSPAMYIYEDGSGMDYDTEQHIGMLGGALLTMVRSAERQYGDRFSSEEREYVLEDAFRVFAVSLGELSARAYLEIAFIANTATQTTLADVIRRNVAKVSGRVSNQQIDKTDNPR